MMKKIIRAGIPVVASHAAVTADAVAMAKASGIMVLGSVKPEKMKVYT